MDKLLIDRRNLVDSVVSEDVRNRMSSMIENCNGIKDYIDGIIIDDTLLVFASNEKNKVELIVEGHTENNYSKSVRNWLMFECGEPILVNLLDDITIGDWDRGAKFDIDDPKTYENMIKFRSKLAQMARDRGHIAVVFTPKGEHQLETLREYYTRRGVYAPDYCK